MFTYFIILAAIIAFFAFWILDRLKRIGEMQEQQHELLQELVSKANRSNSGLVPEMLASYLAVMTEEQTHRYRQWLVGKEHESFTFREIQDLDGKLKATM